MPRHGNSWAQLLKMTGAQSEALSTPRDNSATGFGVTDTGPLNDDQIRKAIIDLQAAVKQLRSEISTDKGNLAELTNSVVKRAVELDDLHKKVGDKPFKDGDKALEDRIKALEDQLATDLKMMKAEITTIKTNPGIKALLDKPK